MDDLFIISDSDEEISTQIVNQSTVDLCSKEIINNHLAKETNNIPNTNSLNIENGENNAHYETNDTSFCGKLILYDLSPNIHFEHLWELFEPFGELESAKVQRSLIKNRKNGVVKFKHSENATKAFGLLKGMYFFEYPLKISLGPGDVKDQDKVVANIRKNKLAKRSKEDIVSSQFLLATNVFDKSSFSNPTYSRRLYLDLLNIINFSKTSVYHLHIDEESDEGAVYMACLNIEDARLVFKALNGCLYETRKVSIDCIPPAIYLHFFPSTLYPSPPLRASSISYSLT